MATDYPQMSGSVGQDGKYSTLDAVSLVAKLAQRSEPGGGGVRTRMENGTWPGSAQGRSCGVKNNQC